jgi:prephenate dehydrogenase
MKISILGAGLIGGSLAGALAARGHSITLYDADADAVAYALERGWAARGAAQPQEAALEADILVFATPVAAFSALAIAIAPHLPPETLVTDTASVKRASVEALSPYFALNRYVPAHPIAGSEQTGIQAARPDLFAGKRVILTPPEAQVLGAATHSIRKLWESAGAKIDYMPADLHDRIYAYVSHLPQKLAFAARFLAPALQEQEEAFQRFARLMRSGEPLWRGIFAANQDYLEEALRDCKAFLAQMAGELGEEEGEGADAVKAEKLSAWLVASCLVATVSAVEAETEIPFAEFAGSGFADMTAPAHLPPEAMLEAVSKNPGAVRRLLRLALENLEDSKKTVQ